MRTDWNSDWVLKGTHSQAKERVRKALNSLGLEIAFDADLAELRGKDLACWCGLDQPCHADVLLELANAAGVRDNSTDQKGGA